MACFSVLTWLRLNLEQIVYIVDTIIRAIA